MARIIYKEFKVTALPGTLEPNAVYRVFAGGAFYTEYVTDEAGVAKTTPAASGIVSDGDKGDVVVSGSGAVWAIDANAVSNAKMATMPTKTYKGNTTGGAAVPTDVPVATLKTDLALVKGDVGLGNVADVDQQNADNLTSGTIPIARVANDAVTYAKIQNVSVTNRLLGRATAGAGDIEEITLGTNLSLTGTTLNAAGGGGGGSGDVVGPASSTDNAVARFDLATGKLIQNSLATLSDTGTFNIPVNESYNVTGTSVLTINGASTVIINDGGLGRVDLKAATFIFVNVGGLATMFNATEVQTKLANQFTWANVGTSGADTGLARESAGRVKVTNGGAGDGEMEVGTLYLKDGTVKQVTFGAADSGGTGFKILRIPN